MTKFQARHIEALAGAVSDATFVMVYGGVAPGEQADYVDGMRYARAEILKALIRMLAEDNERFDVERFRAACAV